ncbi:MAG TPA: HIT family protein [Candidatus Saccharimonadales bacterium]|nr:HIT family protein [Candidatus Saccharimonadales bacterium]
MISHEPSTYLCPFCDWLNGNETEYKQDTDIVFQDETVTAFVAPKWWVNNPGHIIIIPNQHFENLYSIPDDILTAVYRTVKKIAVAMRQTYDCTGISTRQHNEPDGNQSVWHLHVHVFPRYKNDKLYQNHDNKSNATPEDRRKYVDLLKPKLQEKIQ